MNNSTLLWSILGLAIVASAYLVFRVVFWVREGRLMQESGHLAPPTSIFARTFWCLAAPIFAYLTVGPVTVIGRKNFTKVKGRKLLLPNHHFQMDFSMVATAVREHFRYMTTTGELRGLRGVFGAWTGAIPVNVKAEHGGEKALNASIESVSENPNGKFLMFPQGRLLSQDELLRADFKTGAARLLQAVSDENDGEKVWAFPMGIYYIREKALAPFSHRIFGWARRLFGITNYGAVVVVGEPISAADLPDDIQEATTLIFERIDALVKQARSVVHERLKKSV